MGNLNRTLFFSGLLFAAHFMISCRQQPADAGNELRLDLAQYVASEGNVLATEHGLQMEPNSWIEFEIEVPFTGRYRLSYAGSSDSGFLWVEDYVHNTDGRTYNITGNMYFTSGEDAGFRSIDGSPLQKGKHPIRIHAVKDRVMLRKLDLSLIHKHPETGKNYTQNMTGTAWVLKWSDEFDAAGLPDSSKWTYNIGNWGWGNNELQYYTQADTGNAYVSEGNLHIRAKRDFLNGGWTSARLTTQGKVSFTYGKIEFRAKVPGGRGFWTAGWLLGDAYRDEISWPYCGEIDVLESVGFETDSITGNGLNHATCHTRKYYFKQGNQIGSNIVVSNMRDSFHTYAIEWSPEVIYGFVDGERYYTYDKNADSLEWPFHHAQNIILNLAVGGGWGGAKGIDPLISEQEYVIDYVRVYGRE